MSIESGIRDDANDMPLFIESQPSLFPEITPVPAGGKSIEEAFQEFHETNPHVYEALRELAWYAKRNGAKRIGIRLLYERLRWDYLIQTQGDEFKLNDHYHSRYARMLMERDPGLDGIFETRELKS